MENDHHWLQLRNIQRLEERATVRLRRKVIRDRSNPFEDLAEEEFLLRFRLSKECVLNLLENIRGQLPIAADARGMYQYRIHCHRQKSPSDDINHLVRSYSLLVNLHLLPMKKTTYELYHGLHNTVGECLNPYCYVANE